MTDVYKTSSIDENSNSSPCDYVFIVNVLANVFLEHVLMPHTLASVT